MEPILIGTLSIFVLLTGGYLSQSVKIIGPDKQALVERLGRRHKILKPGVNFIVPIVDQMKPERTIAEITTDIDPQSCITTDNVQIEVDAVYYSYITDLGKATYDVTNVDKAVSDLIKGAIRSEVGKLDLDHTSSSRSHISDSILSELDKVTGQWGIKVTRVEIQDIKFQDTVRLSMEKQVSAERERRATILQSEGEMKSKVNRAEGDTTSEIMRAEAAKKIQLLQAEAYTQAIEHIAATLAKGENHQKAMQFLLANNYMEMGKTIGESPSSKVLFMDPNSVPGMVQSLLSMAGQNTPDSNPSQQPNQLPYSASGKVSLPTEKYTKPIDIIGLTAPDDKDRV